MLYIIKGPSLRKHRGPDNTADSAISGYDKLDTFKFVGKIVNPKI